MALEMIDELIEWGRTPAVATADAGYGDTTAFRQGLTDREIGYVVAVKGATSAYPRDATPETAPYAVPRWTYVTGAGVARTCEASEVVRGMFVTGQ